MRFLEMLSPEERAFAADLMKTPDGFAFVASRGKQLRPPHVRYMGRKLADAVNGDCKPRLILTLPPRHGKSQLASHWLPVWYLWRFPNRRVILTSYEAEFAASWGRMVRNTMSDIGYMLDFSLLEDSAASHRWETSKGGGMITAGVGGAVTGRGAELLICDDPVKNSEEAQSEAYRKRTLDWWKTTAYTRLEPGGIAVIIQTRWFESDLAGEIIAHEGHDWEQVNFPAIAEDPDGETPDGEPVDCLGRKAGEALWPERYTVEALEQIKTSIGTYNFSALYQQRPVPMEGGIFKAAWFKRRYTWVDEKNIQVEKHTIPLDDLRIFSTVDLAASVKTSADWTVIATFGSLPGHPGSTFLLDVVRKRLEGPDIQREIEEVIARWNPDFVGVEKSGYQISLIQQMLRNDIPVREMIPDKDKVSRALAATPHCESGRYVLPEEAPWLTDFEHELYTFPNGKHDDMVDAFAYSVRFVAFGEAGIPGDVAPNIEQRKEFDKAVAPPGYSPVNSHESFNDLFDRFSIQE